MNYQESLEFISSLPRFSPSSVKPGEDPFNLDSIRELMRRLGNPQDKLKFVHIAGTNGKGSTAAFINQIMIEGGYKVGLYTSPFIEHFTERIKINNEEIPEETLAEIASEVRLVCEEMISAGIKAPSEFEIVCAIGFIYFARKNCDLVVLEVGLGGRLDATNVIGSSLLSVITTISLDHTEVLGDTLEKIAAEKAGIIKKDGEVLLYPCKPSVEAVFENVCRQKNARLSRAIMPKTVESADINGQVFDLGFGGHKFKIKMLGTYQVFNAAMAVQAALSLQLKGFKLTYKNIQDGLENARWPGRFEVLQTDPAVIIDGSHNEEGVKALKSSIEHYFPHQKIIFITGVLADKNYREMMSDIVPFAKRFYTITPPTPRALPAESLADMLKSISDAEVYSCESVKSAVRQALSEAEEDDIIIAFGSLYYIGEIRGMKGTILK